MTGDLVVRTAKGDDLPRQQTRDDRDGFAKPLYAHGAFVERKSRLEVLGVGVAGPKPELDTAIGEEIECRNLAGDHDRMAEVVVQDERSDSKPWCRVRRHPESAEGCKSIREMIRHE